MEKTPTLRRTPKQARGERRIEAILQAAAQLFDELGYEATTTILIAQRAHTAVGSLYDFFPNKEAVARALVESFTADFHAMFDQMITEDIAFLPYSEILDLLVDPLVLMINVRPGFRALYLMAPQIGQLSEAHQGLERLFTERIAMLLGMRYPNSATEPVHRAARIAVETVKAMTALAIASGEIDEAVIADLKLMLRLYLTQLFEG